MLSPSIEFWFIVQVAIDLCLIVLFAVFIRQVKVSGSRFKAPGMEDLTNTLEPILQDTHKVARQFEVQLKEKQGIVRKLNERLDSRIISLNLLLSRADACLDLGEMAREQNAGSDKKSVYKLQQKVISLSKKGLRTDEIANSLGIAKGEVALVLDLKRKFGEMEKD